MSSSSRIHSPPFSHTAGNDPPGRALPRAGETAKRGSALEVTVITTHLAARQLTPEWAALHIRSETTNPYTHPSWMLTWAELFLAKDDLYIVTVRRGGVLVGVAPFYWLRPPSPLRAGFRALHLLGNGRSAQFTEIPGVLAGPADHRRVLKAVLAFVQAEGPTWDWVKLTLDTQQGWFEPEWLIKRSHAHSPFSVFGATRACVLIDLPGSWEQFMAERKKHVRENLRNRFNRLDKQVGDWSVEAATGGSELRGALDRTIALHSARSQRLDKRSHADWFVQHSARAFYRDVITAMADCGQAEVSILRCGGEMVAGLVALRANTHVYTHVTGADPAFWHVGPGAVMIAELARREIERGTTGINLGAGPNQSKLGWSERLEYNHDFAVVGPAAANRVRFGLYSQASNLAASVRASHYDTRDA